MSKRTGDRNRIYTFPPVDVEGAAPLVELALDMRWSWNHRADEVWQQLDPRLWDLTHSPWIVLQTVSRDQLQRVLGDTSFRHKVDDLLRAKRQAAASPAWFQLQHAQAPLNSVAYFSMEFMLSEALPIYSGGLGNVAGDQLKAASDLGVPVAGVGLLYQQGYFRQVINRYGEQAALYPYNDPGQLPITPLREEDGEWLRVELALPGYSLWLRAWQAEVGRLKLYLLDSNDAVNFPAHRSITSELYGGNSELRLQQELVLGIGGWRLLRALGIEPEVCHLNEGHAAFAVLERARSFMEKTGQDFETALTVTRAGNLFTTHTAVAAGFDRFAPSLIAQYLGAYAERKLGIGLDDLLALGRQNPKDGGENFNMAYLAIRGSGGVNGVSRLHGAVSRRLFAPLFPRWPEAEVPVGHVTNGVHMPSWNSKAAEDVWSQKCGQDHWSGTVGTLAQDLRCVPDAELWKLRATTGQSLVEFTRNRLRQQLIASNAPQVAVDEVEEILDPNALTLGFARRFATYKRPNLLLRDPQRLVRLLTNPQRPVQLILAGKAHPADWPGQTMIREWIEFIHRPEVRRHVVFLADYDMLLTQQLVQGVDVWVNTPRRPWEASGTSGMKVLVNGGINVSELDGWWAEAYTPEVGWAIGDGREHGDDPGWDAVEAAALYDILEHSVVPEFYERDANGIPTRWLARMRESMARLAPQFSADRTVREYTEQHYLPSAATYRERAADNGAVGKEIVNWRKMVERKWTSLRFGEVKVETKGTQHIVEVQVYLDDLDPKAAQVELYAEGVNGGEPVRLPMQRARELVGAANGYVYTAAVPANRPAADYTVRIVPHWNNASVPLEVSSILWQR